ncbi:MAG: HAMP domain-containing protein [Burkholderiaceae bacterium]|nr:HAMP domain-containing protein [Burkholderiaceae bacterium]
MRGLLRGRWLVTVAALLMLTIGIVLLFLLTRATDNRLLYERYYNQLYAINAAVAAVLGLIIAWGIYRLIRRLVSGKFGSRLLIKLAAIFALVGVLPGLLIYVVSYQFVSRSIESWFDVKVEGALNSGLNLARTSLEAQASEFGNQLSAAAIGMSETPDALLALPLERLRAQIGAIDATLWSGASGRLLASAGQSRFELNPERPPAQLLRLAREQVVATQIEGLDEDEAAAASGGGIPPARVRALVVVKMRTAGLVGEQRIFQAIQPLPQALVGNALAVQQAYREYQERALGRSGLRRMYIGTLTLTLFLTVFGAVLLAVMLGKQMAAPLLALAEGVRSVAAGDLTPRTPVPGRDEIARLTHSFADMTRQIAEARATVERSMRAVDAARANLQTIVDNLTAGVVVLDARGRIVSPNPGAIRILRTPLDQCAGQPLSAVAGLQAFGQAIQTLFADLESKADPQPGDHWQQTFELYGGNQGQEGGGTVTLVARGARLPEGRRLLVFDDISEVVSAQRVQAWGEVARRLAHEIKNPLTPIQLSAERLAHKLAGKLGEAERAVLEKSVKTIVDQVDAMKRLVNEFRDYARLPAAEMKALDLNGLVRDVLHLYGHVVEVASDAATGTVCCDLDPQCPMILGDAAQLRQVIHNLVQNAFDATEASAGEEKTPVLVRTQWLEAAGRVRLSVLDGGGGFAQAVLGRAFEPYVTTKAKGTGLGLAVVKKIADDHGARIEVVNRQNDAGVVGAQVSLSFVPADAQRRQGRSIEEKDFSHYGEYIGGG